MNEYNRCILVLVFLCTLKLGASLALDWPGLADWQDQFDDITLLCSLQERHSQKKLMCQVALLQYIRAQVLLIWQHTCIDHGPGSDNLLGASYSQYICLKRDVICFTYGLFFATAETTWVAGVSRSIFVQLNNNAGVAVSNGWDPLLSVQCSTGIANKSWCEPIVLPTGKGRYMVNITTATIW